MLKLLELILPTRLVERINRKQGITDSKVQENYLTAGESFGTLIYLRPEGEQERFNEHLDEYVRWEKIYSDRGYKTVPLLQFVQGNNVTGLLGKRRNPGEDPILHGENYKRLWNEGNLAVPHGDEELKAKCPLVLVTLINSNSLKRIENL